MRELFKENIVRGTERVNIKCKQSHGWQLKTKFYCRTGSSVQLGNCRSDCVPYIHSCLCCFGKIGFITSSINFHRAHRTFLNIGFIFIQQIIFQDVFFPKGGDHQHQIPKHWRIIAETPCYKLQARLPARPEDSLHVVHKIHSSPGKPTGVSLWIHNYCKNLIHVSQGFPLKIITGRSLAKKVLKDNNS